VEGSGLRVVERKPEEASCERAEFGQRRCRIGVRAGDVVASDIRGFKRSARPKHSASGNGSDAASRDIFSCAGGFSGSHGTGCCIERHASAIRCKRAASYERFRERRSAGRERGSNAALEQQGRG
jgi:hypothetical protein